MVTAKSSGVISQTGEMRVGVMFIGRSCGDACVVNNSRSEVKSTCPRLTQLGTQSAVRSVFALLGFAVFVFLAALFLIALFAGMILFVEHAIVVGIEFGEFLLGLVRVFGGGDELCFGDVTIAIGILFLPVFGGFLFRFLRAFFLGINVLGGEEQGENR